MTTNNSKLPTGGRSVRVSGAEHPGWPQLAVGTSHHPRRTVGILLAGGGHGGGGDVVGLSAEVHWLLLDREEGLETLLAELRAEDGVY